MFERIEFYSDDNFKAVIQIAKDGVVHLHCYVYDWKLSALKIMYREFARLKGELNSKGYKYIVTVTPNPKFARLFGGEVIDEQDIDGVRHEVIVWELKPHTLDTPC